MNLRLHPLFLALAALALVALGIALGRGLSRSAPSEAARSHAPAPASGEREVLYWYDPMVPNQRFDKPGKSPFMDMDLVPRYADEAAQTQVRIDPGMQQNLGIRSAEVKTGTLEDAITVPGTLDWDRRLESVVAARVEGLVSRVDVRAPFTPVRRGQRLAQMLAPQWSTASAEARALAAASSPAAQALQEASRQRLRALGLPGDAAGSGSLALLAPHEGVVTEVLVREGETVAAGAPLFRITRLDTLWLEAAVPQALAARLAPGAAVQARVDARPGEIFPGRIEALLPQVDPASRTQTARIVLDNADGRLAPGLFAQVTLSPEAGPSRTLIPNQALIATGSDSRVIVQRQDGAFEPVRVQVGRSAGGQTEILAGLSAGDWVVTSGQFLIDSEASLSGALERLSAPAEMDHGAMDHGSMNHGSMDHGSMDHGSMDHGSMDHGSMDHGSMDHGSMDHGSIDHGSMDHGSMDHGSMDHGAMDHGSMDHGKSAQDAHADHEHHPMDHTP